MKKNLFTFFFLLYLTAASAQTEDKTGLSDIMTAGAISVTIGGDFIVTGSYPAFITERVDQFITRMYNESRQTILSQLAQQPELLKKSQKDLESYSIRNITLKRNNGEELKLDLLKFRKTGDFTQNPYLKNDDVLIFPPSDLERNFFSISGAVNKPGKYHFRDGDKLTDAIELAQGINKAYENVTKAEVHRLSYDGEKMDVIPVDLNSNFTLERGDRIIVIAEETQKKEFSVVVVGEVKNPGEIPITKNTTTLKEVIEKAGGVTEYASLHRSKLFTGNSLHLLIERLYGINLQDSPDILSPQFFEVSDKIVELENAMMYRMSNLTYDDTSYFFLENQIRVLMEGSSLDLSEITNDSSEISQHIVRDGDIVIIPQKRNTVYVFGQVASPGHIAYSTGKDAFYYINQAGGMGRYAQDEDEIVVIKAGGRRWIPLSEEKVRVEEGDYIYVPRVPMYPFNYYVGQVGNYLSIAASAATVILLLIELSK